MNYELCLNCRVTPDCNRQDAKCFYRIEPRSDIEKQRALKRKYNATYAKRHPEKVRKYIREYMREYRKARRRKVKQI